MRTSRLFAPLAFVGAIFVAVAVALYFYAVPRPMWTTSSPEVQGDFEFMGVYKGMPRHLAKHGMSGFSDAYTGDLWAYFRVRRSNLGEVYSRVMGTSGAETAYTNGWKKSSPWPNRDAIYLGVPVPSEYPAELQNGKLELSDGKKTLGTWRLQGMSAPKEVIDPLEPNKLRAEALGHRLELVVPMVQRFGRYPNPVFNSDSIWTADLRVASNNLHPQDKYEYQTWLKRTCWSAPPKTGWSGSDLPANGIANISLTEPGALPSKRIEVAVNVVRFRTAPDSITLHDVVLELSMDGTPGNRGYNVVRCSDKQIVSKQGIRFQMNNDTVHHCPGKNEYNIGLLCEEPLGKKVMAKSPLSKSLNKPIELYFRWASTGGDGKSWQYSVHYDLPAKLSCKTAKLKTLTIPFEHKAKLEEKTVYFIGPTK